MKARIQLAVIIVLRHSLQCMNQAQRHLLSKVVCVLHIPRICKAGCAIVIFKLFTLRMVSRTRELHWESLGNRGK